MGSVSIKDLQKGIPSKSQSLVHDGDEGTKRVEFADLLAATLGTTDLTEAGFHNSIFRGADLKARFGITDDKAIADEVTRRISNGTFEDLYVGDYFKVNITTEFGTEDVEIVLAGFDVYMKSIYEYDAENDDCNPIDRHHAVCVTKKQFAKSHRMHPTTPIPSGGYAECEINTTTLPKYATALNTVLNGHIMEICDSYSYDLDDTLTNANAPELTGVMVSGDYGTTDFHTHLTLLTERELYGAPVYSSGPYEAYLETSQLPLFRLNPASKITGSWYWLKDVASAHFFCGCDLGGAYCNFADLAGGVRPRFLIG